jgi:gliding motility-associated-like protein
MSVKYILPLFCALFLAFANGVHGQLVVNEFSQGASGNKEYIELVVFGQRTCNDTCADIRGWIFDDNNGWHGSTAISPGSYRFSNDANWSCVPYGAIIVIYNSGDVNGSLPADDPTDANNDRVYVVPVNSPLIELHTSLPNGAAPTYPGTGFGPSTTWTNMALNNSNDAVQTIDPANLTAAFHAVSYGSGVVAPVHINASGSQKVYYLTNDQYNLSAGWTSGTVPANETPGAPNTAANATWINAMLNGIGGGTSSNDTIDVAICQGSSYFFNGNTYSTAGFYTATFTTSAGCDSIVTIDLTVNPIPAVPVVVSPVSYCMNETAVALSAAGQGLLWYTTPSGGTGSPVVPIPSTAVTGTFIHYVSQTVNGCESARGSITVVVNPLPPLPQVTSDTIVLCQSSPAVTLTAQGTGLLWYTQPTGGTGMSIAPVILTDNGHTEHWYVTQTLNGCESERTPIFVRVSPSKSDFTLSTDTLCISDSLLAANLSLGNDDLNHWDFGDGFIDNDINGAHRYRQPGLYTVMLAIRNGDGCTDTSRKTVWVSPVPDLKVFMDKHHICTGDEVNFNLDFTAGFYLLTWDFGDGTGDYMDDRGNIPNRGNTGGLQFSHAYEQEGTYFFSTSVYTPGCPLAAGRDSVNVFPMPKVSLGPDSAICLHGAPIVLRNTFDPGPGEHYLWSTGDTAAVITARHHGDFKLTVNTAYCSNSDVVHIAKDCYVDIPNAFTPNGDGANDYFFPRQLLTSSVTGFKMQVLNRWGQLIFETTQKEGRGWDGRLNGTDQPAGVYVYMIQVIFRNGMTESYQGNVTLLR